MDVSEGQPVQLYVYDLSNGLCAQLSHMLLGRRIEAIYHTSIVAGGVEYYYGGGIQEAIPGTTPYGRPIQILDLGRTEVPQELVQQFLIDISDRFSPQAYRLMSNNCNNFSDELAHFLTGAGIPSHITGLPSDVLSTPFGASLAPLLGGLEAQLASTAQQQLSYCPRPLLADSENFQVFDAMQVDYMLPEHAVTRANPHPDVLPGSATASPATAAASPAAATASTGASSTPVVSNVKVAMPPPAPVTNSVTTSLPPPPAQTPARFENPSAAGRQTPLTGGQTPALGSASSAASRPTPSTATRTPLPAATPMLPPAPRKAAVADSGTSTSNSAPAAADSPSVAASAAAAARNGRPNQVLRPAGGHAPEQTAQPPEAAATANPEGAHRALRFETPAPAPRPVAAAATPAAAAAAAAAARSAAASAGSVRQQQQQTSASSGGQAAFQAALQEEFQRILATGVSANEAASLALRSLHSRLPELSARG